MYRSIVILGSLLLAQSALAADWYVQNDGETALPAGIAWEPNSYLRKAYFYGDGHEVLTVLAQVQVNGRAGDNLLPGTEWEVYWDPNEVEPCPECSPNGVTAVYVYPGTGWRSVSVLPVPGEPAYLVTYLGPQPFPYPNPASIGYYRYALFYFKTVHPAGDRSDYDVWTSELPAGGRSYGLAVLPFYPPECRP